MDSADLNQVNSQPHETYRLSWIAYIRPVIVFFILSSLATALGAFSGALTIVLVVLALLLMGYQILFLHSIVMFINDDGVWYFRGILPWKKGTSGIRWRDIEIASFTMGFSSWAFNAYTVTVANRFNKTLPIILDNVRDGRSAVETINRLHQGYIAENTQLP